MEERQATIDGITHPMPDPFLVIATQNPIEYEGTFALPEAQLDRFMLRIRLGYPQPIEEIVILDEQKRTHPLDDLDGGPHGRRPARAAGAVREIYVDPTVSRLHRPPRRTPRGPIRTSTSAPRRAGRSPSTAPARRSPGCSAATTSSPMTSRPSPSRRWPIG